MSDQTLTTTRAERVRRNFKEWFIEKFIAFNGIMSILIVALICIFLLRDTLPVLKSVGLKEMLTGTKWYPISEPPSFGILPLILGSLLVTLGSIVIALPFGLASAIYIAEVASPRMREWLKPAVELLAAVPSVVLGFIGLVVLAPFVQKTFHLNTGLTALTGCIMLAFMAMPTIVSISEDAIVAVPKSFKEASLALGANRWETIRHVTVPSALSGIVAAVMLGVGRAIGETMAVMMATGNAAVMPRGLISFLEPIRTMTATIAAEMGETVQFSPHYYCLFAIGMVLFAMTFIINFIADLALHRIRSMGR